MELRRGRESPDVLPSGLRVFTRSRFAIFSNLTKFWPAKQLIAGEWFGLTVVCCHQLLQLFQIDLVIGAARIVLEPVLKQASLWHLHFVVLIGVDFRAAPAARSNDATNMFATFGNVGVHNGTNEYWHLRNGLVPFWCESNLLKKQITHQESW